MKLKISEISHNGESYLEPEDKIFLFKHCSGGAVAVHSSQILPIIELIEMHGEKVGVPHVESPRSEVLIRKSDGVEFYLKDGVYYHEDKYETEWAGYGTQLYKFNLVYFEPKGKIITN